MDYRAKLYSNAVFFVERWFIFITRSYFSGPFYLIFRGLFELDMLL